MDDLTCKRCKENLPRPSIAGDREFLEVEGEKYGVVTPLSYIGIHSMVVALLML